MLERASNLEGETQKTYGGWIELGSRGQRIAVRGGSGLVEPAGERSDGRVPGPGAPHEVIASSELPCPTGRVPASRLRPARPHRSSPRAVLPHGSRQADRIPREYRGTVRRYARRR